MPMPIILSAEFETSAADASGWPAEGPVEIAFVGRSNVGKSSLLNALVERRGLARTSAEPGRTRLVNFFTARVRDDAVDGPGAEIDLRLVDLPGFGYAKVSKAERSTWRPAIERYLAGRRTLVAAVLLVDPRRVPERPAGDPEALLDERELHRWIAARGVTVIPVLTKCDKLPKHERTPVAERLRQALGSTAPVLFSALSGEGRARLLGKLLAAARAAPGLTPPDAEP